MQTQDVKRFSSMFGRPSGLLMLVAFLILPMAGQAANVLKGLTYSTGAGGQVEMVLEMEQDADDPLVFSTHNPARIALDLVDTSNALNERSIDIKSGATNRVTAVEAGGRTRVVIDLYRPETHNVSVDGKYIRLTIGEMVSLASNEAMMSDPVIQNALANDSELTLIDFRRGKEGQGKVVLQFSDDGANVSVKERPDSLHLTIPGVMMPESLQQRLDVTDFATPVSLVDSLMDGSKAIIKVSVDSDFEYLAYQTGSEFVLEVSKPVVEEEEKTLLSIEDKLYEGNKVNLSFHDIEVRTVLQILADFSGLNIVVGDSVEGSITLRLIQVPWDQALDIILDSKSLDMRQNGNVIWVAPAEEIAAREQQMLQALAEKQALEPLKTDYIQVNYAKATELAAIITETSGVEKENSMLSGRGSITVDERTNTLLVTDVVENINKIRNVVALLDRPVKQVQIESRIVIASIDFRKELGARFGVAGTYADSKGNIINTGGNLEALDRMVNTITTRREFGGQDGLPTFVSNQGRGEPLQSPPLNERLNVNLPLQSSAGAFSWSLLAADYLLDLELSALEQEGKGEVVSTPRVITANQQEARISQGQEIAYLEASASGAASVKFKEVALELNVTPLITPDDRIVMDLNVKKDNVSAYVPGPFNSVVPVVDTRRVQTQVLVNNGQTVVLGGVYESTFGDDLTKVPLLGDMPVVGNLFKRRLKRDDKDELLIFVTPTILQQNVDYQ